MSLLKSNYTIEDIENQLKRKNVFNDFVDILLDEQLGWMNIYYAEPYDPFHTPFRLIFLKMVKKETSFNRIGFDNQFIKKDISSIVKNLYNTSYYYPVYGKKNPSAFITYYSLEALYEWYDEIEKSTNKDEFSTSDNNKLLEDIKIFLKMYFYRLKINYFNKLLIIVQTTWDKNILI